MFQLHNTSPNSACAGSERVRRLHGADCPEELVTIEEKIAKAIFGNDLSNEQWTETWKGFVADAAGIMNARLSGYPDGVPITYVSLTEDVAVPLALAEQMIANLGDGVDHRVLSAGHMVMVSKPRELAELINDVVGRKETAASASGS
jgi:pimeloyl-ACP methyl ester carboxylesterase